MPTDTASLLSVDLRPQQRPNWLGVVALMLGVFVLVTSEFLPASLLSPMAHGLGVSEGVAGQAVTATALVGIVAGPGVGLLFPRLDRRRLLVGLAVLAVVSNALVAVAPNFWLLLVGRVLLGIALSGYWSMAAAIASQLVPARYLGRALMIVNMGVSMATVVAVPLGAYLGDLWGWRTVFAAIAVLTLIAAVVLLWLLPSVAAAKDAGVRALFETVRSPVMIVGLLGLVLVAGGHFAGFTYIRLGADNVPHLGVSGLALLLALYGIGGFFGNLVSGFLADRRLSTSLVAVPALLGVSLIVFASVPQIPTLAFAAVVLWGFAFGGVLTLIQTWSARMEPQRKEAAGGLVVAGFQLAIAVGAAVGGFLVDGTGVQATFVVGGVATILGGVLLGVSGRRTRATTSPSVPPRG
ncbi:MFS transporter [Compostimonas suwonensis]|uniref:DHA1 family purine ribonucleoside efflux pump-like MFS transporter n=1 Tax=Compostimonas suwonensis TaxID=1048394 RepID=A0A2M9BBA7_9MICO|nr:MFS transporter [Compostimonas suwonensis]PJJ55232.1 DHA1 family purine ribonucleoside efflux pump-like MFS transporter [Compostimonas suwonensis]